MSRDILSSSSSDDEANYSIAPSMAKQKQHDKKTEYKCPADFVSFCHKPCSGTLTDALQNGDSELWVIKAPANFNPECFNGVKIFLSGLQTSRLHVPTNVDRAKSGSGQQVYSVLASSQVTSELHLLTGLSPSKSSSDTELGPTFSGLLNVCESYGNSSANQAPQAIPAAPVPSIPQGLKQRFQPFGSKTPTLTCMATTEVDRTTARPAVKHPLEDEQKSLKKKKKKKDTFIKTGREEVLTGNALFTVKEETVVEFPCQEEPMAELTFQKENVSGEKRRKNKKKERKRQEEMPEALEGHHTKGRGGSGKI